MAFASGYLTHRAIVEPAHPSPPTPEVQVHQRATSPLFEDTPNLNRSASAGRQADDSATQTAGIEQEERGSPNLYRLSRLYRSHLSLQRQIDDHWSPEMQKVADSILENAEDNLPKLLAGEYGSSLVLLVPATFSALIAQDQELAVQLYKRYQNQLRRFEYAILESMAQTEPDASWELLEEYAKRTGQAGPMAAAYGEIMIEDPERALAMYESAPDQYRPDIAAAIGGQILAMDTKAGLAWMAEQALPENTLALTLMRDSKAAAAAEELLYRSTDSAVRGRLLSGLAMLKAGRNPGNTLEWLSQFSSEPGYTRAAGYAVEMWASKNAADAAQYLQTQPELETAGNIRSVAAHWAFQDPVTAIDWADGLQDPALKASGLGTLALSLVSKSPQHARHALSRIPPGTGRERAIFMITMYHAGFEQGQALTIMTELGLNESEIENVLSTLPF